MDTTLLRRRTAAQCELFAPVLPRCQDVIETEADLAAICVSLIDDRFVLSAAERALKGALQPVAAHRLREQIECGADPLGDAFGRLRSAAQRRSLGAVYTPDPIVGPMMQWLVRNATPSRVVDPGAGSGRFVVAAGIALPSASLVAVEVDPLAALVLRANLAVHRLHRRTQVVVGDFRDLDLSAIEGTTAYIGNPPYVRHHDIGSARKDWYRAACAEFGIDASTLAGLHLHFFAKTAQLAAPGDIGIYITAAEWLDVNYGAALRQLLATRLGVEAVDVLEPTVCAFPGTATTAAITAFRVGTAQARVRVRAVADVDALTPIASGTAVSRSALSAARRWSEHVRPARAQVHGEIELGELFRVHRGQVTGSNACWIAGDQATELPPSVLFPAVTRARELFTAGPHLASTQGLRRVVDLPADLSAFADGERESIDAFLHWAKSLGADVGYIARHRRAWWSVGLKSPAPILCTYMARRPPQFTVNGCDARHINIAHGLYPRAPLDPRTIERLVAWLNRHVTLESGRVYAGGLTKFEPKEVERLRVPRIESLAEWAPAA